MKHGAWIVLPVLLMLTGAWVTRGPLVSEPLGASSARADEKPGGLPPLEVGKDAPRLTDEPTGEPKEKPSGPVADNSSCFVCHNNYHDEPLAVIHANGNVGCIDCHGKSLAHRNDEDNITPPDIMYPAERIDAACNDCHDSHDAPARDVIAMWQKRCPQKTDPKQLVCTDCHGEHRLERRVVEWDKRTGKLLPKEGSSAGSTQAASE